MKTPTDDWQWPASDPAVAGWYAVRYCWDAPEGCAGAAAYWSGADWRDTPERPDVVPLPVVGRRLRPFADKAAAAAWAKAHDF